mmetsp:Transcript_47552/g.99482  ORF Transcript_47552/g.99482 Transcript_47552/m.99482 type:complete len:91 (-) Transcript_47552:356-628(-)
MVHYTYKISPFKHGMSHMRSCTIDSGPWGNNATCYNNLGSHTAATGKYYQDSDNVDRPGRTMGSMWYDAKTNGSWAIEQHGSEGMKFSHL